MAIAETQAGIAFTGIIVSIFVQYYRCCAVSRGFSNEGNVSRKSLLQ